MNIVIVGLGKIGTTLTKYLAEGNHDVTVIDSNAKVVEAVVDEADVMGISGTGASYDVLMEAGANKAKLFIAMTGSDEMNILSCLIAKKMGAKHTIARVRNPEYSKQLNFMRDELGISMLVNPEYEAANEMARILHFPSAIKIDSFAKGRVELAEVKIKEGNPLIGEPISAVHSKYQVRVLICAVQRGEEVVIPRGDFVLQLGDKIHITASRSELSTFMKKLGIYKQRMKKVMVVGGGKIGYYLTKQLLESGQDVKLIERDEKRCLHLSEMLPKAEIICGDGADQDVLLEEGLEQADALVSLTGIDEENIIISMFANIKGVAKVVTKINRVSFDMLSSVGLETVISPKQVSANKIVRYVRALENSGNSSMLTLYRLVNGAVEAAEFEVVEGLKCVNIPFKDIRLKKNILIGCIIRNNKPIYPGGNDMLLAGDRVVIVTTQNLQDLDDILL